MDQTIEEEIADFGNRRAQARDQRVSVAATLAQLDKLITQYDGILEYLTSRQQMKAQMDAQAKQDVQHLPVELVPDIAEARSDPNGAVAVEVKAE